MRVSPGCVVGASLVPVTSNNLFLFCFLYKNLQQSDILVLRVSWCRCWVWGPWGPSPAQGGSAHWAPPAPQLPFSPSPGEEGHQAGLHSSGPTVGGQAPGAWVPGRCAACVSRGSDPEQLGPGV